MKYAFEMGSGIIICKSIFMKIGSAIRKLIRGIHRHTENMEIA
jgi:hypothetical protein